MAYELVETIEIGSGGSTAIEFTNIPQTAGADLLVKLSLRTDGTGGVDWAFVQFNGESAETNYDTNVFYGNGSSAGSLGETQMVMPVTDGGSTSNTFSSGEMRVIDYTSSNKKVWTAEGVALGYEFVVNGNWDNTAAITSLKLVEHLQGSNFLQYSTASLYIVSPADASGATGSANTPKATGGTISFSGGYFYHVFGSNGTFTPSENLTVDYAIIAGGGSGGASQGSNNTAGGGGGAGGVITTVTGLTNIPAQTQESLTSGVGYSLVVGAGGASATATAQVGNDGDDSTAFSKTAIGGGGGGSWANGDDRYGTDGRSGGSGGGGGCGSSVGASGGSGTTNQGTSGGSGGAFICAGGGGGASQAGSNASTGNPGNGGDGVDLGLPVAGYVAGGGAGLGEENGSAGQGAGSYGGGGNGGDRRSGGGSGQAGQDGAIIIWYAA